MALNLQSVFNFWDTNNSRPQIADIIPFAPEVPTAGDVIDLHISFATVYTATVIEYSSVTDQVYVSWVNKFGAMKAGWARRVGLEDWYAVNVQ